MRLQPVENLNYTELRKRLLSSDPNQPIRIRILSPDGPHLWVKNYQLRQMGVIGVNYETCRFSIRRLGSGETSIESAG